MNSDSDEATRGRPSWRLLLMLGAVLLLPAQVITALVPAPPADSGDVLGWVADHLHALRVGNELKMFASVLLLAGVVGLATTRRPTRALELLALAAFGLAAILVAVTVLVEGRLAYPVFGLQLTAATAGLVVSSMYGALHAVSVLFAVGILAVTFSAVRVGRNRFSPWAGAAAGMFQVLDSFPWLMPAWVGVIAAVTLFLWTLAAVRLRSHS